MAGLSCSEQMMRIWLLVVNVPLFLGGVLLIAIGIYGLMSSNDYEEFEVSNVNSVSGIMIAVGIVVSTIGFLGCCGAYQRRHWMMYAYSVAILVLMVPEVTIGFYAYVYRGDISDTLWKSMSDSMAKYESNSITAQAWDTVQQDLECCGSDGPESWKDYLEANNTVPDSCCETESDGCGTNVEYNSTALYQEGCHDAVQEVIEHCLLVLGHIVILVAMLQLWGIIFGCCLGNAFRDYQSVGYDLLDHHSIDSSVLTS